MSSFSVIVKGKIVDGSCYCDCCYPEPQSDCRCTLCTSVSWDRQGVWGSDEYGSICAAQCSEGGGPLKAQLEWVKTVRAADRTRRLNS